MIPFREDIKYAVAEVLDECKSSQDCNLVYGLKGQPRLENYNYTTNSFEHFSKRSFWILQRIQCISR